MRRNQVVYPKILFLGIRGLSFLFRQKKKIELFVIVIHGTKEYLYKFHFYLHFFISILSEGQHIL